MSDAFLTNADGSIPENVEALPATRVGQYAKNAVDAQTRAVLVKPVAADPDTTPAATFLGFNKTVAATGTRSRIRPHPPPSNSPPRKIACSTPTRASNCSTSRQPVP